MNKNNQEKKVETYTYQEYLEKFLQSKSNDFDLTQTTPFDFGSKLAQKAINELKISQEKKLK